MSLRVTDPDFESELSEKVKAAVNGKFGFFQYDLPLPLLLLHPDGNADEFMPCQEPAEETTAISAHMSARIHAFYEQIAAACNGIEDLPAELDMEIQIKEQKFDPEPPFCYHRRYHSRRLQLHDPDTLPDLPFISSLSIRSQCYDARNGTDMRPLSPLVPLQCLVHLPAVQQWIARWLWERPMPVPTPSRVMREYYTWPWEGPLRDARHEFGAAIMDQEKYLCGKRIPASLTKAALHFWPFFSLTYHDESVARPNLIHPAHKDPVSVGLRKLGAQLSLFDLRAMVTPDLFPSPEASTDQQWSQMRRFRLEFHPLRPDGRWYFVGPDGEDPHDSEQGGYKISDTEHYPRETDTEEDEEVDAEYDNNPDNEYDYYVDMFRIKPCRERIEPLLIAFAKCLTRDNMPSLEDAEIFTYLHWYPDDEKEPDDDKSRHDDKVLEEYSPLMRKGHRWGVKFIAGRGITKQQDGNATAAVPTSPVVQWQVGDWRPSEEVTRLFENLGQQEWLDLEWNRYRFTAGQDVLGNSESSPV